MAITISLKTHGCKLNQAESENLAAQLETAGYAVTESDTADVFILNTCTVTRTADHKARQWLRAMRRLNPSALLVAIGCYAERAREELEAVEGVDLVISNGDKDRLPELLREKALGSSAPSRTARQAGRVRSMVKAQSGCDASCTYCVVPAVRGAAYSVPENEVVETVNARVRCGYKEVVLTGTEIGCYRDNGSGLRELVGAILSRTDLPRLRLSSLQPQEIRPELVSLWREPRLCPHFHIALQSGSDTVLKRMGRRYSVGRFRQAVNLIRGTTPEAAITTDVMVGFPGENAEDFTRTMEFCQEVGFARIHVFPYSPRPGTPAALMPDQVPAGVKSERVARMLDVARESARVFEERFLGRTERVLFESETGQGGNVFSGLTGNYIRVFAEGEKLLNEIATVRLSRRHKGGVWGVPEPSGIPARF